MRKKMTQKGVARLAVGIAALLFSADAALANTQSVTANINFDTPLSLSLANNINFGTVAAPSTGNTATYTIDTTGAVTVTGGTGGQVLYGSTAAGSITVAGSATQTVAISVGSYLSSNHVVLSAPTCSYAGSAVASCTGAGLTAPAGGKPLLLGISATVSAGATTAEAPSYTVTVIYG